MRWSILLVVFFSCALSQDLYIKNSCKYVLWAEARDATNGTLPGEKNVIKKIDIGGSVNYTIPDSGLSSTRFWAKYGCDENGANCAMGDQVANFQLYPQTGCPSTGCTPPIDSLFEATWGCKTGGNCGATFFDTSQVDGWTLPYRVLITGNTQCDCTSTGCTNLTLIDSSQLDITHCPNDEDISDYNAYPQYTDQDLRVVRNGQVVGCKSPCKHMSLPPSMSGNGLADGSLPTLYYCCPTPDPTNCQINQGCILPDACRAGPVATTQYVKVVHAETKGVYAYSYDDGIGEHACPPVGVTYTMEYCPPGSPPYPYTPPTPPANVNQGNVGVDIPGTNIAQATATSGLDCAQQCDRNSACTAWSWEYPLGCNGNTCSLKGQSPGERTLNPCRESNAKLGDIGIDRSGNDLPNMPISLPSGSTASTCATQCSLTAACYAWAFDSCGGVSCWLKTAGGTTTANSCRISGIKGHIGFDIAGNDLSMLTLDGTASATTCSNACATTAGCHSWAMVNPIPGCQTLNWCWLKTAVATPTANSCVIWGQLSSSSSVVPNGTISIV